MSQFQMLLSAFVLGVALGIFWELLVAIRILLRAYTPPERMRRQYEKKLPLLGRSVPFDKKGAGKRAWAALVVGVGDCFYCLVLSVAVILLLYRFHDGAFRLSVPVLTLAGLSLCRYLASRSLSPCMAYLAYGFAAATLYLGALAVLPFKLGLYLARRFVYRPWQTLRRKQKKRRMAARSAALCQAQLIFAQAGLTGQFPNIKDEKKKGRMHCGKKKSRRQNHAAGVDDTHPDPDHLRGIDRLWHQQPDEMESKSPAHRGRA
ncbi:MAG: hypothetical protein E7585_06660 [Ruminococcaceae bacterium]|nr:hypothetical protein [Oscillospiraceae bacterium]